MLTVEPVAAEPITFGELSLAGEKGSVAVTVGAIRRLGRPARELADWAISNKQSAENNTSGIRAFIY